MLVSYPGYQFPNNTLCAGFSVTKSMAKSQLYGRSYTNEVKTSLSQGCC